MYNVIKYLRRTSFASLMNKEEDNMKRLRVLVFVALLLISCAVFSQYELVILHTSDLHGHIYPVNYATNKYSEVGLAKIATLISQEREKYPDAILVDSGDLIQGSPLEYYHARVDNKPVDPMILAMNYLNYDFMAIGNHEFDYGLFVLKKAISEAQFPVTSANIVKAGTNIPYFGKPYIVKVLPNGIKVGILALTTKYIPHWEDPKNIKGLAFLDPVEVAKRYVKILRDKEKVDVVVVAYHGGLERDPVTGKPTEELTGENQGYQICEEVPGIDVLLTGHQHREISNCFINGVLVSQPGSWGRYLGVIKLDMDKKHGKWVVAKKSGELLSVKGVKADEAILHITSKYEETVQNWLDKPIGVADGDFYITDPFKARMLDNPLMEFVNKVEMYYSGAKIASTALFSDSIKGWKKGPITLRDILAVYIYPNTLKVVKLKGKDIKAALERSAEYFTYKNGKVGVNKAFKPYCYDMWEGINYVIDPTKPVGSRVVKLNANFEPMDMNKEYEVVLNNYRAAGGGGYPMLANKPVVREVMMEVSELMADYILKFKHIKPTVDFNWRVTTKPYDTSDHLYYLILPNDTLSCIAKRMNTTVEAIAKLNNIKNPNLIYAWHVLKIY